MASASTFTIRLYRKVPGDLNLPDLVAPVDPYKNAVATAKMALQTHFDRANEAGKTPPLFVELVSEDGIGVDQYRMTPDGIRDGGNHA